MAQLLRADSAPVRICHTERCGPCTPTCRGSVCSGVWGTHGVSQRVGLVAYIHARARRDAAPKFSSTLGAAACARMGGVCLAGRCGLRRAGTRGTWRATLTPRCHLPTPSPGPEVGGCGRVLRGHQSWGVQRDGKRRGLGGSWGGTWAAPWKAPQPAPPQDPNPCLPWCLYGSLGGPGVSRGGGFKGLTFPHSRS